MGRLHRAAKTAAGQGRGRTEEAQRAAGEEKGPTFRAGEGSAGDEEKAGGSQAKRNCEFQNEKFPIEKPFTNHVNVMRLVLSQNF